MLKIRTILFDLDGVLVDAKMWHFEAFNAALAAHGYLPIEQADHLARFDGLPSRTKLALLAQSQPIAGEDYDSINRLKQKLTLAMAEEKCAPNPLHVATLRKLKADGYRMAVCSNSVRASVDMLLQRTGLIGFFEFTLSNEDVAHPKPHPEIYATAMERLGALPAETLVLEDNAYGIEAARGAGAHVLEIRRIQDVDYAGILQAIDRIRAGGEP